MLSYFLWFTLNCKHKELHYFGVNFASSTTHFTNFVYPIHFNEKVLLFHLPTSVSIACPRGYQITNDTKWQYGLAAKKCGEVMGNEHYEKKHKYSGELDQHAFLLCVQSGWNMGTEHFYSKRHFRKAKYYDQWWPASFLDKYPDWGSMVVFRSIQYGHDLFWISKSAHSQCQRRCGVCNWRKWYPNVQCG